MKRYTTLLAAALLMVGCYEVELEIPVVTNVAVITGNEVLNKANTRLHGEILEPAQIDANMGVDSKDVSSFLLTGFTLQLTDDSLTAGDTDDLQFLDSMVIYARSLDSSSGLKEIAVAWYYKGEQKVLADGSLEFEVDPQLELLPYMETGFELFSDSVGAIPADDVSVEGLATFLALTSVSK